MNIESVAVFCGSQAGNNPVYLQHAIQLGEIIANQNMTLVYGGGNGGLMGTVALLPNYYPTESIIIRELLNYILYRICM